MAGVTQEKHESFISIAVNLKRGKIVVLKTGEYYSSYIPVRIVFHCILLFYDGNNLHFHQITNI